MDEGRNTYVERRMKDALKHDAPASSRAASRISASGMSRQRIRPRCWSLSTENARVRRLGPRALGVVGGAAVAARQSRNAQQGRDAQIDRAHPLEVALYVLNTSAAICALWKSVPHHLTISADATVNAQVSYMVDRGEQVHTVEAAKALAAAQPQ